jgi:type II secretory pathway component PulK
MKNEKASVLILVLWVLIILSLLSMAVSSRSSSDIKLAKYEASGIKSLYLARAGVAKAIAGLNKDNSSFTSLNQDWNKKSEFSFGGGMVRYRASDEAGLVNINGKNLKKENLERLGIDGILSDRIMKYRDNKKGDKDFEFMEELFLIDGMTKDIYDTIKPYVTIYIDKDAKININTASENVLRAILGENSIVSQIIRFRSGDDGYIGTADDGIFEESNISVIFENFGITPEDFQNYQAIFSVKSDFFRITAEASFSEDKKAVKVITAVVNRGGEVYYWKEE